MNILIKIFNKNLVKYIFKVSFKYNHYLNSPKLKHRSKDRILIKHTTIIKHPLTI